MEVKRSGKEKGDEKRKRMDRPTEAERTMETEQRRERERGIVNRLREQKRVDRVGGTQLKSIPMCRHIAG